MTKRKVPLKEKAPLSPSSTARQLRDVEWLYEPSTLRFWLFVGRFDTSHEPPRKFPDFGTASTEGCETRPNKPKVEETCQFKKQSRSSRP